MIRHRTTLNTSGRIALVYAIGMVGLTFAPITARAWRTPDLCVAPAPIHLPSTPGTVPWAIGAECPLPGPSTATYAPIPSTTPASEQVGIDAYRRGVELLSHRRFSAARLQLDVAERNLPQVADWIALKLASVAIEQGSPAQAAAFLDPYRAQASEPLRLEASTQFVRAKLAMNDPAAIKEIAALIDTYPAHPNRNEFSFARARMLMAQGDTEGSVEAFRTLAMQGADRYAEAALAQLISLRNEGEVLATWTAEDQAVRAYNTFESGPLDIARALAEQVITNAPERASQQARAIAHFVRGELNRHRADWVVALADYDAARTLAANGTWQVRATHRSLELRRAIARNSPSTTHAELSFAQPSSRNRRVAIQRLVDQVKRASDARMQPLADASLEALLKLRPALSNSYILSAATRSFGTASPDVTRRALQSVIENGSTLEQPVAAYYLARLEESLRKNDIAIQHYESVRSSNGSDYYRLWADVGLTRLRNAQPKLAPKLEGFADSPAMIATAASPLDIAEVIAPLASLHAVHGAAYPWFERARLLLLLGESQQAGEELYLAYMAYRDANGRSLARAGRASIALDANRNEKSVSYDIRRARKALTDTDRQLIATIATQLERFGVARGIAPPSNVEHLPRAYSAIVTSAARRHGLDPNLLFAVMRVESVYQRSIVSYAGAVGLLQIMPRTGALIAQSLGVEDFKTEHLLDPATNLDFGAWYLASLIRRFDGRLPLAIAAYNGGQHNVRRWMFEAGAGIPLDMFLERIPFEQTHRYVRRVLGYYAAYRAQESLPMQALSTSLPPARVDNVAY